MFCQPDGRPVDPRHDWEDWKELLRVAGVRDARVHDGRHTSATLLLECGVDVRIVMEILGHSDLRVTTRYTHIATPLAQEAARRMGQALWGGPDTPERRSPQRRAQASRTTQLQLALQLKRPRPLTKMSLTWADTGAA